MRIHQLSAIEAIARLKSGEAGLSRAEVERRLQEFGRNEVQKLTRAPLCRSATRSVFSTGRLGNPLILFGVASEIAVLLLVNFTSWDNSLLGTASLAGPVWLFSCPSPWACLSWKRVASGWAAGGGSGRDRAA